MALSDAQRLDGVTASKGASRCDMPSTSHPKMSVQDLEGEVDDSLDDVLNVANPSAHFSTHEEYFDGRSCLSSWHKPYQHHMHCGVDCKRHMFHAVIHFAPGDKGRAEQVKEELKQLMLDFLDKQHPARVALESEIVTQTGAGAVVEIAQYKMTEIFIILRTANYDKHMENADAKRAFERIVEKFHILEFIVEDGVSDPTSLNKVLHYNPKNQQVMEEIRDHLGRHVEQQLIHDRDRRLCEQERRKKLDPFLPPRYDNSTRKVDIPGHRKRQPLVKQKKKQKAATCSTEKKRPDHMSDDFSCISQHAQVQWQRDETAAIYSNSSGQLADESSGDDASPLPGRRFTDSSDEPTFNTFSDEPTFNTHLGDNGYANYGSSKLSHERHQPVDLALASRNTAVCDETLKVGYPTPEGPSRRHERTTDSDSEGIPQSVKLISCHTRSPAPHGAICSSNSGDDTSSSQKSEITAHHRRIKPTMIKEKVIIGQVPSHDDVQSVSRPPLSGMHGVHAHRRTSATDATQYNRLTTGDGVTRELGRPHFQQKDPRIAMVFPMTALIDDDGKAAADSSDGSGEEETLLKTLPPTTSDSGGIAEHTDAGANTDDRERISQTGDSCGRSADHINTGTVSETLASPAGNVSSVETTVSEAAGMTSATRQRVPSLETSCDGSTERPACPSSASRAQPRTDTTLEQRRPGRMRRVWHAIRAKLKRNKR